MKKILVCLLALALLCCAVAIAEEVHTCEYVKTSEIVKPTCTAEGYTVYACSCGASIHDDKVPALGHSYGEPSITFDEDKALTVQTAICTQCGDVKTVTSEVSKELTCTHPNVETVVLANTDTIPTCTQDGTAHLRCVDCKKVVGSKMVGHLGHDWDDGTVTTKPTCLGTGVKTYVCKRPDCDNINPVKKESLPAEGHDFTGDVKVGKAATCTEDGFQNIKCTRCDEWDLKTLPKLNHFDWKEGKHVTLTKDVVKPTCTKTGKDVLTCECGATKDVTVPALGHLIDKSYDTKEPQYQAANCGRDGYFYRTCEREGCTTQFIFEATRVPAVGNHVRKAGKVVVAATCYKPGVREVSCSVCGKDLGTETYYADHTWEKAEGTVIVEATCYRDAQVKYTCSVPECKFSKIVVVPTKIPHAFYGKKIPATCLEHGYVVTMCDNKGCDLVISKAINPDDAHPLGHQWYTTKVDKPLTCTTGAKAHQVCLRKDCKAEQDVDLPAATNHDPSTETKLQPATCASGAYTYNECKACGAHVNKKAVTGSVALGHTFPAGAKEATCTKAGTTSKCDRCGLTVTRPATGHKYTATVHDNGCGLKYTRYVCQVCGKKWSCQGASGSVTVKVNPDQLWGNDVTKNTQVINNVQYVVYTVDTKTVKIPVSVFTNDSTIGHANQLILKVVKTKTSSELQCSIVTDGKTTDCKALLTKLGMIVD